MNIEDLRLYCLSKKGTTEGFPFDETALVFKVMGKIFAICSLDSADRVNLKCEPIYALSLRERYPEDVFPGFHMNKKHWNTVMLLGSLTHAEIRDMIDHSYDRVVAGLRKSDREALKTM